MCHTTFFFHGGSSSWMFAVLVLAAVSVTLFLIKNPGVPSQTDVAGLKNERRFRNHVYLYASERTSPKELGLADPSTYQFEAHNTYIDIHFRGVLLGT